MRSTWAAVPACPTASRHPSVSGVATRVRCSDLGVRQFSAGKRLGQERQRPERARHADLLSSCAEVEANAPAQPGGTGAEADVPTPAGIELADQVEKAGGGGLEVRGQLGVLVTQPFQFRGRIRCGEHDRRVDLHGESPFWWVDSTPGFRRRLGGSRAGERETSDDFRCDQAPPPVGGPLRGAEPVSTGGRRHCADPSPRGCQVENAVRARLAPGDPHIEPARPSSPRSRNRSGRT